MQLHSSDVQRIADLARIDLTPAELDHMGPELSRILEYVSQLNEVSTDGIQATAQVTGLENVYRPDEVMAISKDTRDELLALAPHLQGDLVSTPPIFESSHSPTG